jgi:hypothetical protein
LQASELAFCPSLPVRLGLIDLCGGHLVAKRATTVQTGSWSAA